MTLCFLLRPTRQRYRLRDTVFAFTVSCLPDCCLSVKLGYESVGKFRLAQHYTFFPDMSTPSDPGISIMFAIVSFIGRGRMAWLWCLRMWEWYGFGGVGLWFLKLVGPLLNQLALSFCAVKLTCSVQISINRLSDMRILIIVLYWRSSDNTTVHATIDYQLGINNCTYNFYCLYFNTI